MMGNRGVLSAGREYQHKRWVCCPLDFPRTLAAPRRYTKLFFLDEATALAAGHRPCGRCRQSDYREFKSAWIRANPAPWGEVDNVLHRERLDSRPLVPLDILPDGCMVALLGQPYLVRGDSLWPWTPAGYAGRSEKTAGATVILLTPASIVKTLLHGYKPRYGPESEPLPKS
jgi:hypothetical protein